MPAPRRHRSTCVDISRSSSANRCSTTCRKRNQGRIIIGASQIAAAAAAALFAVTPSAHAGSYYWNVSSGNWSNSANWSGGAPVSSSTTSLIFGYNPASPSVNDIAGGLTLNTLYFSNSNNSTITGNALNFVANGSTSPAITTNANATDSIANAINLAGTTLLLNGTGSGNLTLSGKITGTSIGSNASYIYMTTANQTTLTGVGSSITGNFSTSGGTLVISSGGTFSDGYGQVAYSGASTATVTGSGSTWSNSSNFLVGVGATGVANILNGGAITTAGYGYIGLNAGVSGTLNVSGSGSAFKATNNIVVGYYGNGTLNVTNSGLATTSNLVSIGAISGSTGVAKVDGKGSTLSTTSEINVGETGTGTLTVTNGGVVSSGTFGVIGYNSGSNSTVTIDGSGSAWNNGGTYFVGYQGTGQLNLTNGGTLNNTGQTIVSGGSTLSANSGTLTTGTLTGTGTLKLTGNGLTLNQSGNSTFAGTIVDGASAGNFTTTGSGALTLTGVGSHITGTVSIENGSLLLASGATFNDATCFVSSASIASNITAQVSVDGSGTTLSNSDFVVVGMGGIGSLSVTNGGTVTSGANVEIGYHSGYGIATVNGAGSTWTDAVQLTVGDDTAGELDIINGGAFSTGNSAIVGSFSGQGVMTVDGTGSAFSDASSLTIGYGNDGVGGSGTLNITNGGTVTVNGGTSLGSAGTIAANGGSLTTTSLTSTGSTAAIELSGAGLTLNQSGNSTFSGKIADGTSAGSLTKTGAGTLTLTGANTYTGGTTVSGGTLALGSTTADGSGALNVNGGATVAVSVSNALGSGAITLNSGTLAALTSGISQAAGSLTITGGGTSYLDFGAGSSNVVFTFADSSMNAWNGTLDILNDPSGDLVSITGLTGSQLADIYFINPDGMTGTYHANLSGGHLVVGAAAAPEPGALALLLPALSPLLLPGVRRRLRVAQA